MIAVVGFLAGVGAVLGGAWLCRRDGLRGQEHGQEAPVYGRPPGPADRTPDIVNQAERIVREAKR